MMKKIFSLLIVLFIFASSASQAFAAPYTVGGAKNPTTLDTLSIVPPLHTGYQAQTITGVYNEPRSGEFHRGTDYDTYDSSVGNYLRPVYPIANGTVYGLNSGTGTRYVIIQHSHNGTTWYSTYLHLNSVSVAIGDPVTTNTQIGVSGTTGATAYHLHWEVNTASSITLSTTRVTVDPFPYLANTYGATTFTQDHSLVNFINYFASSNTLQASIYGIYSKTRSGPTVAPKAYWRYSGQTTWNVATGVDQGSYVYYFTVPADYSKTYVEFLIYTKGKWFDNINTYDTHWNTVYNDPPENPGSWTSSSTNASSRYYF